MTGQQAGQHQLVILGNIGDDPEPLPSIGGIGIGVGIGGGLQVSSGLCEGSVRRHDGVLGVGAARISKRSSMTACPTGSRSDGCEPSAVTTVQEGGNAVSGRPGDRSCYLDSPETPTGV